jgi:protein phosphatase
VIVSRDEDVARRRFGVASEGIGICYTRTGRRFFADNNLERALLERVERALTPSGIWEELESGWGVPGL